MQIEFQYFAFIWGQKSKYTLQLISLYFYTLNMKRKKQVFSNVYRSTHSQNATNQKHDYEK